MSAFVVSDTHIDALVTAGRVWEVLESDEEAQRMGAAMKALNIEAVSHRYEAQYDDEHKAYRFSSLGSVIKPVIVFNALACYAYQACELPDWNTRQGNVGKVRAFLDDLYRAGARRLRGWDDAPWEVNDRGIFGPLPYTSARRR